MSVNLEMWQTMFATTVPMLRSHIKLISENFTFENPGMFPNFIISSDVQCRQMESCNLWLVHQYMAILNNEHYGHNFEAHLDLQTTILAAANVKQPWFFFNLIERYIKTLDLFIKPSFPINVKTFIGNEFDVKSIEPTATFPEIIISSEKDMDSLLAFCVKVLSQFANALFIAGSDLFQKCFISVINAMRIGNFQTKMECFEFLYQFIKCQEEDINPSVIQTITTLLYILKEVLRKSNGEFEFLEKEDLKRLDVILTKIFKAIEQMKLPKSIDCTKLLPAFWVFLDNLVDTSELRSFETEFWNCMNNILKQAFSTTDTSDIMERISKHPLFSHHSIHIIQYLFESSFKDENQIVGTKLWESLNNEFEKSLKSTQEIEKTLCCIIDFLKMVRKVDTKLESGFSPFQQEMERILTDILNLITNAIRSGMKDPKVVLYLFRNLLQLKDFIHISDSVQCQILEVVLFPLAKPMELKFRPVGSHFPKIMELFSSESNLGQLSIAILSSLNRNNFRNSLKNKIRLVFEDIITKCSNGKVSNEIMEEFLKVLPALLKRKLIVCDDKMSRLLRQISSKQIFSEIMGENMKTLICLCAGKFKTDQTEKGFHCEVCESHDFSSHSTREESLYEFYKSYLTSTNMNLKIKVPELIPVIRNHFPEKFSRDLMELFSLIQDKNPNLVNEFSFSIPVTIEFIFNHHSDSNRNNLIEKLIKVCTDAVKRSLELPTDKSLQLALLNVIKRISFCHQIEMDLFLRFFKMALLYLLRVDTSHVINSASLVCEEMCIHRNIVLGTMFKWYRQSILKLMVTISVILYLSRKIPVLKTISNVAKLFNYTQNDFVQLHYQPIIAMLLPYVVKHPSTAPILNEICGIIQKDLKSALTNPIIIVYLLNEPENVLHQSIDFMISSTGLTFYQFLNVPDIKEVVAELLINYHKNPQCVTKVFRCLLTDSSNQMPDCSLITNYISSRFLGNLIHFEMNLVDNDNEKDKKKDALLSLGEIIRFMGSSNITPFRFKIVSLLRTAMTLGEKELTAICAKVWEIFIHNVDIQWLGPLLSTIVVSMEPLLKDHPEKVNSILRYLILSNGNLLSTYLEDLFFIKSLDVEDEIKMFIEQHHKFNESRDDKKFERLFEVYVKQINHDNLAVRIYGIQYLTELFSKNRSKVNHLIMGHPLLDSEIERTLNLLMLGCKNVDNHLKIASSACLGEIGAIEPTHLRQNYAPQKKLSLSVLSDDFAIAALPELCQAFQFQKDTKYVDNFSLAIQDILQHAGVDPKNNKKMEIWNAIPERMRQLMEPFLTSTYINTNMANFLDVHPIFGQCRICEEWAYIWALNMVQTIENEEIKSLLSSFKPSIKKDSHIMALVLPYIVLHSLQYSKSEYRNRIKEEFDFVFKTVSTSSDSVISNNLPKKKAISCSTVIIKDVEEPMEENTEDSQIKCAKLAFNLLDFLNNWCRECEKDYEGLDSREYKFVLEFVKSFDKKLMAMTNFKCGEFARALLYIEQFITENPATLQSELSFLGQIYANLQDSDSLEGAMALKTTNLELTEQILLNNVTGRLDESAACYERMIQENEVTEQIMREMVQCYLNLDQPETALTICNGLWDKTYQKLDKENLFEINAEPLWRLGRFEELDNHIENFKLEESNDWGVRCGQTLLSLRKNDKVKVEIEIEKARKSVLKNFRIAGVGENSYQKGYPHIFKLHLLTEIEKTLNFVNEFQSNDMMSGLKHLKDYFTEMESRLQFFKNTNHIEQILCLRRILFKEVKTLLENKTTKNNYQKLSEEIDEEIGKYWLHSTKLARKSGSIHQANLYVLQCEKYKMKDLFIEKAKLLWNKGDQTNAFRTLNKGIENIAPNGELNGFDTSAKDQKIYAKAKFYVASFNAQSMNIQTELNIKHFKDSIDAFSESEKTYVHYAQFLDKIYLAQSQRQKQEEFELLKETMSNYGKSMQYGFNFIYQSMPRMLSIWLDYTSEMKRDDRFGNILTQLAASFSEQLPIFAYFTAFSQLVSRICHPSDEVYNVLKTILVKLIIAYPQQSMWMILSVLKSSYPSRKKRCVMIMDDKRLKTHQMDKFINDFNQMADRLIELTNKEIPNGLQRTTVSQLVRSLPRLIGDHQFSQIIIPNQKNMQPVMPSPLDKDKSVHSYIPFTQTMSYIQGIAEEVQVLLSLQKPRKITLRANDGIEYNFLLKPKDDLRKDFRLMEFNSVVKHYLYQDPEAKERRLDIRTYEVLPLNEECGIIEWLNNLKTLRLILNDLYRQNQGGMNTRELKTYDLPVSAPLSKKRDIFQNIYLKRHPSVFDQWFKANFTTSHNWYLARSAYTRTCGVISVVGYILGLGDRHCDNILLDQTNGDVVHVDFNCLFNNGETFPFPERVPFRLTHNMVHAMGPLGVEGLYRKSCEVTLRVLRAHNPALMSILRPFVYDPLVTWRKTIKNDGSSERTDSDSMTNINNIDGRLKGFVKIDGKSSNMPLSTEGQINFIIKEAVNINNLCRMFIGWAPYQ